MTHEERASVVKYIFLAIVLVGIGFVVWKFSLFASKDAAKTEDVSKSAAEKTPGKSSENPSGETTQLGFFQFHIQGDLADSQLADMMKSVKCPDKAVAIVVCHLPGDPTSEQEVDILHRIQRKYGKQVVLIQIDFKIQPKDLKGRSTIQFPRVSLYSGTEKMCQFQGFWSQSQVEKKVEEILRGLKRVGKDWRPVVPGMRPVNQ